MEATIILPRGAKSEANVTEGIAENGQEVPEIEPNLQNVPRQIITFRYQNDPLLYLRYKY